MPAAPLVALPIAQSGACPMPLNASCTAAEGTNAPVGWTLTLPRTVVVSAAAPTVSGMSCVRLEAPALATVARSTAAPMQ